MYKWFSSAGYRPSRQRKGVTLVEILIVTVVIALLAAVSFPVYKIVQQREKEKRLKKILNSFRSAIKGSKSALSAREFIEGYRSYVIAYGSYLIDNITSPPVLATAERKEIIRAIFTRMANRDGFGLPSTPQKLLEGSYMLVINVSTGLVGPNDIFTMNIPIDRRFIRRIPPHPFLGWVPDARFEFKAAVNTTATTTFPFYSLDWGKNASGVSDIVSRGAGLALNGSRTDDW